VARAQAYIAAHHIENITLGDLAHPPLLLAERQARLVQRHGSDR